MINWLLQSSHFTAVNLWESAWLILTRCLSPRLWKIFWSINWVLAHEFRWLPKTLLTLCETNPDHRLIVSMSMEIGRHNGKCEFVIIITLFITLKDRSVEYFDVNTGKIFSRDHNMGNLKLLILRLHNGRMKRNIKYCDNSYFIITKETQTQWILVLIICYFLPIWRHSKSL